MSAPISIEPISDSVFDDFRELIYREAGISLGPAKRALLTGRLAKRLRALGLVSFRDYLELVVSEAGAAEKWVMLDCISTNETSFFREARHWDFIVGRFAPGRRDLAESEGLGRQVRAWSAGCSSGQEPYSLAMALLSEFPASDGWNVEIVATDISGSALEAAHAGIWRNEKAANIPEPYLHKYMLRGVRGASGMVAAGPQIRQVIKFQQHNLFAESTDEFGKFDLIMCRNVLIYFSRNSRALVIARLRQHLASCGYLFVGHAESLTGAEFELQPVAPNIYRHNKLSLATTGQRV